MLVFAVSVRTYKKKEKTHFLYIFIEIFSYPYSIYDLLVNNIFLSFFLFTASSDLGGGSGTPDCPSPMVSHPSLPHHLGGGLGGLPHHLGDYSRMTPPAHPMITPPPSHHIVTPPQTPHNPQMYYFPLQSRNW